MNQRLPKIGDKVKMLRACSEDTFEIGSEGIVTELDQYGRLTFTFSDGSNDFFVAANLGDEWEILSSEKSELTSTTTEQVEKQEVQEICKAIDEAIFYDGYTPPQVIAKSNQVVAALVEILVSKGLLTSSDVKRVLQVPALTNVRSSEG